MRVQCAHSARAVQRFPPPLTTMAIMAPTTAAMEVCVWAPVGDVFIWFFFHLRKLLPLVGGGGGLLLHAGGGDERGGRSFVLCVHKFV